MLCTAHEKLKVALSNCKKLTKSRKSNTGALWNRNDKYGSTFTPFWRPSSYCRTPGPGSRGWKRPDPGQGGDEECRHA